LVYTRISDGTIRLLEWNLVTTSLGVMVEPRCITKQTGAMQNEDLIDSSFTDLQTLPVAPTGNYALDQLGWGSSQWPHYRDNDPLIVE
jgi:hypothetical protein